ncbi:MAG: transposase [Bacteroidia bacterium]
MYSPYFLTSVVEDRKVVFSGVGEVYIPLILESLEYFKNSEIGLVHAFVIMPNHIHILISLAIDPKKFQHQFLSYTAHRIIKLNSHLAKKQKTDFSVSKNDRQNQLWRENSKMLYVPSLQSCYRCLNYIHHNPCQPYWSLVSKPSEYQWSSAHYKNRSLITPIREVYSENH